MTSYYISRSDFNRIIEKLIERSSVFAPVPSNDRVYIERITTDLINSIVYDSARPVDPLKTFLSLAKEVVAKYFENSEEIPQKQITLIGVKACDAAAIMAYDKIMLEGDYADDLYKKRRDACLIIGSDCASIWPTCFCSTVGLKPFPEKGIDINFSTIEDGFMVEIFTEKGKSFYNEFAFFFREATKEETEDVKNKREKSLNLLKESNQNFSFKSPIHEIVKGTLDSPAWKSITKFCIECGACNITCPTCTCFMMYDRKSGESFEKVKHWDACLKSGYARVAGGANSRPLLPQRYNNRLQCKFDYSFERTGSYTCTGCGRCIEACPAKIDMRSALKDLEKAKSLPEKAEKIN